MQSLTAAQISIFIKDQLVGICCTKAESWRTKKWEVNVNVADIHMQRWMFEVRIKDGTEK